MDVAVIEESFDFSQESGLFSPFILSRRRTGKSAFFVCAILGLMTGWIQADEKGSKPWKSEPGKSQGWVRRANYLNRLAIKADPEICFVGDSLTEFWNAQGSPIWQLEFQNFRVANQGMAADRIENILWRLKNGALDKIHPKVFVLMLGTNNLSKVPPDEPTDVVHGITSVLKLIQKKLPESHVLLVSILANGNNPESNLRKSILETNAALRKMPLSGKVEFIDVHDEFVDSSGKWRRGLTVDGTHLTMRGYEALMNKLREPLAKAMK